MIFVFIHLLRFRYYYYLLSFNCIITYFSRELFHPFATTFRLEMTKSGKRALTITYTYYCIATSKHPICENHFVGGKRVSLAAHAAWSGLVSSRPVRGGWSVEWYSIAHHHHHHYHNVPVGLHILYSGNCGKVN